MKYKGIINIYTSIVFDYKEANIYINNSAGRVTRPVYKVKDKKTLITPEISRKIIK